MRKKGKLTAAVLVLVMALSVLFSGCEFTAPDMKISIDGKEFKLNCKVSEILDAGFELADIDHPSHVLASLPPLDARVVVQEPLFIYKNGKASHVGIYVYNKSVNQMALEECTVYAFDYDCGVYSQNANETNILKVTFNGIDFRFTDRASVLSKLEGQGFKFNATDKESFLKEGDAYSKSLVTATNLDGSSVTVYNDYTVQTGERTVNGFDVRLGIKYDTSGM
jgi:hypothetical protein